MLARFRRSTSGLVVLVALGFVVATLGIGLIAYEVTHEALEEQLDHRVAAETAALLAEAQDGGLADVADAIERREAARSTSSLDYLLVGPDGRHLAGRMEATVPDKPGYEELLSYRRSPVSGIAQALTTRVAGGTLIVAADRAGLKEIDGVLLQLFSSALAAMLALGVTAAGLVGWITRRRLAAIDATALAIIDGDLSRRVPRNGSGSEFDRLAATVNRMLDRIGGLMDNLRQVSSDVAHDLRTPLTRLHAQLDRALAEDDPENRLEAIARAREQAGELLEIFASLLRIAEVEGLTGRLAHQRVDLSLLLEQIAETYRPDIEASGHTLFVAVEPGIAVMGDRRLLNQALANLLDNSLRHTPAGTTTTVSVARGTDAILIRVSDDGPGLPPRDAERVFQRFARGDAARTTPGHGLGLALVAAIATAHGGSASLDEGMGFSVLVQLPSA